MKKRLLYEKIKRMEQRIMELERENSMDKLRIARLLDGKEETCEESGQEENVDYAEMLEKLRRN